jgi:hypothetical protein
MIGKAGTIDAGFEAGNAEDMDSPIQKAVR